MRACKTVPDHPKFLDDDRGGSDDSCCICFTFEDLAYKTHVASMQTACVMRLKQVVRDLGVTRSAKLIVLSARLHMTAAFAQQTSSQNIFWHAAARVSGEIKTKTVTIVIAKSLKPNP